MAGFAGFYRWPTVGFGVAPGTASEVVVVDPGYRLHGGDRDDVAVGELATVRRERSKAAADHETTRYWT